MSMVLTEFASEVVAFEREPSLASPGAALLPNIEFRVIETLRTLPAIDGEFDLAMTFTVLQHLSDEDAEFALNGIKRIIRPDGWLLICEETDEGLIRDDPAASMFLIGRRIAWYRQQLEPMVLLTAVPRAIEPGYAREHVGDLMLFAMPAIGI
jgi:SAM-dependent methyltransferase